MSNFVTVTIQKRVGKKGITFVAQYQFEDQGRQREPVAFWRRDSTEKLEDAEKRAYRKGKQIREDIAHAPA